MQLQNVGAILCSERMPPCGNILLNIETLDLCILREQRCLLEWGCQGQRTTFQTSAFVDCLQLGAHMSKLLKIKPNQTQTLCTFLLDLYKRSGCLMASHNMFGMKIQY